MLRTELIRPLPELLMGNAERFGDKVAFRDERRSVTYTDLENRTRRLAGHLSDLRLQPGDRAAILLANSVEVIESYLAITRASAIGVPLNPQLTEAELAYLLDDSGARIVVTDLVRFEALGSVLRERPHIRVIVVGAEPAPAEAVSFAVLADSEPVGQARDDLELDDVAWMLYTSGTTGRPKGVLSTQRNCLWSVAACYVPIPELSAEDRVLWPLPLFHSLSHIACVLSVTAVGATARIVDGFSADEVLAVLREESSTFLAGVPTMYHHLVRAARERGFQAPDLRMCLVGGAVTTAELRKSFEETFGAPLLDAYGSTETCGSITINWPTGARVEGSCGLPVPGLGVRLIDPENGLDVSAGAEGEVWVSGPSVMVGYHNQPEATRQAVTDGWYRTGDLARRDEAGYFTITGRIKELIIRGGENIHPGEVESVIRQLPGVADVAVVGKPHEVLGEIPVAFIVASDGGFDPDDVFAACREQLTYFKLPEELYEIDRIPRTASGKITRHVLLEQPARLRASSSGHYETLLRLDWIPVPSVSPAEVSDESWAVLGGDRFGIVETLATQGIEADEYADFDTLMGELANGRAAPRVAVLLVGDESGDRITDAVRDRVASVERQLTAYGEGALGGIRLVVVTRGAVAVGAGDDVADLASAPVWGVVRTAQLDAPEIAITDLGPTNEDVAALPLVVGLGEPQTVVRQGVPLCPRLTRILTDGVVGGEPFDVGDGTVMVTGVDSEPGAAVARHLVAVHGVRRLLLTCPDGAAAGSAERLVEDLGRFGAEVSLVACDPADRSALAGALRQAAMPVRAVVHTQSTVDGAVNLHELTGDLDLRMFVLVGTSSGLLGGDRAGESAFLDALARRRGAHGMPALNLAWDLVGTPRPNHAGVRPLSTTDGLAMFDAALGSDAPTLAAVKPDTAALESSVVPGPLRGLIEVTPETRAADPATASALRAELTGLSEPEQRDALLEMVRSEVSALSGVAVVAADRAFKDLGFTSTTAVELRTRLVVATGLSLPAALAFNYPSVDVLVGHLYRELFGAAAGPEPTVDSDLGRPAVDDDPVVIVGMGCRLPGGVCSPEDLWGLVVSGGDAVGGFPVDRGWDLGGLFDVDPDVPGTTYVRSGGFLGDVAGFDAEFFGISPREALAMDPQQRLLLEVSWETIENAGINPKSLRGQDVGVFFGMMHHDYASNIGRVPDGVDGYLGIGKAGSVASGRVSYVLGLEGPAVTVDTACSSSLVALHLAVQSVQQGECSMALAGGVAVMATPDAFIEFSRQRALSVDGRCKSFSDDADGTAWAEGVGVVLVERLSVARRLGHVVLGVVRGCAV
ncbi:acyl-CoA synthetase (AMP-forming)/AMP-acid ligase II, partial [Herbihabitans rhizosphaerae]